MRVDSPDEPPEAETGSVSTTVRRKPGSILTLASAEPDQWIPPPAFAGMMAETQGHACQPAPYIRITPPAGSTSVTALAVGSTADCAASAGSYIVTRLRPARLERYSAWSACTSIALNW